MKSIRITLFTLALLFNLTNSAHALTPSAAVKATPLLKSTSSWNQIPIQYPTGTAEITGLLVEIAPGAETGWHLHPVPSFGYIIEGELDVHLKDGKINHLKAGDALVEVVNTLHNGKNVGQSPVKLVVFYSGSQEQALTIKEEDLKTLK